MKEELWVIEGNQPCIWSVPYYATAEDETTLLIYHAVPLLRKHQMVLEELLNKIALKENGQWRIMRENIERIGRKVPLCDPDNLFTWERERATPPPPTGEEGWPERKDFLDSLYLTGLFQSRDHLTAIYNQMCLHMLDWIINKEKPIDLHFARLHNCPYRANWKHVLLSRFPRLGRLLVHVSGTMRDYVAHEVGFSDELVCPDLLALNPSGLLMRTIEVELRPVWHKNIVRVERNRFARLGPPKYGKYVMESLARWMQTAVALYSSWLTLLSRRSAANAECGPEGQFRLVPNTPPADVLPEYRKTCPVPVVVPCDMPAVKDASPVESLYPKNGILPDEMPPVRSSGPNVRDDRQDLYKRERAYGRKFRLLLLDARESENPLQLLGQKHGTPRRRLAERTEQLP